MSFVTDIKTLFDQIVSLIKGYIDLIANSKNGLLDFTNYFFTRCIPAEFQGLFLFLLMLLIVLGCLRHIK